MDNKDKKEAVITTLLRKEAPDFTAPAVMPDNSIKDHFNLKKFLSDDYGVVFFYAFDFSSVCSSEVVAFSNRRQDFIERGVKLVAVSADSELTHKAWRNVLKEESQGAAQINIPLIADFSKDICRRYGVLLDNNIPLRGSFIIDNEGIIRYQSIYDLPIGRLIDEILRVIDALQFTASNAGQVCPAGWRRGSEPMVNTDEGIKQYMAKYGKQL